MINKIIDKTGVKIDIEEDGKYDEGFKERQVKEEKSR